MRKNCAFDAFELLEKTLESLLDCREIQPVNPKGDQSWMFIGRTDVEAETPILWPPDAKSRHPIKRLKGNVNITFENVDAESLLLLLSKEG